MAPTPGIMISREMLADSNQGDTFESLLLRPISVSIRDECNRAVRIRPGHNGLSHTRILHITNGGQKIR